MKNHEKYFLLFHLWFSFLFMSIQIVGQDFQKNYVVINPGDTPGQIIEKAANVTPSNRQYEWQKLEMTGFIHFGINTFNEVEWGTKNTDITKFNPTEINVKQWVKVFKEAGFKLIILTTKHHDGFCLWPSKFTDYNISHTPFQGGKGDIVRDLSKACKDAGIKFGVYLSPWDMHEKTYGTPEYNTYFMNQLTELLTNNGEISEVWFDGACGEGTNGKKQIYDWNSYYQLIRKLQPNAVIAVMGPDVRWVGTESGYGRQTEWSVLPGTYMNLDNISANSQQQALDGAFIPRDLTDDDLGSRDKIKNASSLIWYPAEIDVSIRPRWFYHEDDDEFVKSPSKLVDIYYNSVGLNGVLLLNIPPDKRGLIHENDIKALQGMRYILDNTFKTNLAQYGKVEASNQSKGNEANLILDDDLETFWTTEGKINTASIEITFDKKITFNRAMLQEYILKGQRIEKFRLEWWDGIKWNIFAEGTTIGYKRLLRFPEVTAKKIKIIIDECRTNPTLSSFGLYLAPPEISFIPDGGSFTGSMQFQINCDQKNSTIYYTVDGGIPNKHSKKYNGSISINNSTTVTAIAISDEGEKSLPIQTSFNKAKYGIDYNTSYDNRYPGHGLLNLVDGVTASKNFNDGKWQGFHGTDLDVVIDLKEFKKINKISSGFLQDINSYIFLPESVKYSVSKNGKAFNEIAEITNDIPQNDETTLIKRFELSPQNISARFIRIQAKSIGICPKWHKGTGDKAWIFADEISIE